MIKELVEKQRKYFLCKETREYIYRKNALGKLRQAINKYEPKLKEALMYDLGKNEAESYFAEIGIVLKELTYIEKHLKKLMKNKKVKTHLVDFPARSFISPHPYGVVLVISPWNYPVMLSLCPLIGAIAAGNTVILKPSEFSAKTSEVLKEMINSTFNDEYVKVVTGSISTNQELLDQKLDYIFFTGSTNVGKIVMEKAAKNLTPISLELGGKSPVLVTKDANIKVAAKRIAFGKYLNAGQTCVAPDYLFIHESKKTEFVKYFDEALKQFFGDNPIKSKDFGKIINDKHYTRLLNLMEDEKAVIGGVTDDSLRKISPTLLDNITYQSKIMQEEIFGPILPMITYENIDQCINYINKNPNPLALYLFTSSKETEKRVLNECNFGGGCINDTIMQVASDYLPFGGVGESGMGSYHGKASFDTFSHFRSILKKSTKIDIQARYAPYTKAKEKLTKMILK